MVRSEADFSSSGEVMQPLSQKEIFALICRRNCVFCLPCFRRTNNCPCTRRGILSTASSIFDPLGFIALLLLEGKSILQVRQWRGLG